jgi:MerR family transcriptional regulator, redox-sensitive transcriptional activator SoxR
METMLTINEVSRRSGVAASALRFYEERSLIASERAGSGHRRYPRAVLRRVAFIIFAQRIGLTLDHRQGAREASCRPRAHPPRLGASLGRVDATDRPKDRRA